VLAPTREEFRVGDTQRLTVFQADTTRARAFLRPGCCDVIVADAPYGVAHRSRSGRVGDRSPVDLLARAIPRWAELLRRGGAVGLSFNTHTADRSVLAELLTGAGLSVVEGLTGFAHWVDQGIIRDLIVARRADPGAGAAER
jgi:tRNA G10  N-methylase Trm11